MKKYTQEEIIEILKLHEKWLKDESGGKRADLRNADLSEANLRNANLSEANLWNANLRNADLRNADLRNAISNMEESRSMQLEKYRIFFTKDILAIGCKQYSWDEWRDFTDRQIAEMDDGALKWWNKWKEHIFQAYELTFGEVK